MEVGEEGVDAVDKDGRERSVAEVLNVRENQPDKRVGRSPLLFPPGEAVP